MPATVNWHYPRDEIAESILDLFDTGSTHAITIFAKRRMGKTEMLLEDLWPLAEKRGYNARYASFWLDRQRPERALVESIIDANMSQSAIKARIGLGGSFIEATRDINATQAPVGSREVVAAFKKMTKGKKPTLLLLDEVQQLATTDANDDFVATLRSLLDTNKSKVKVVFTGSSREGLIKMFKRQNAPLFNFSHQYDLPELGSAFVKHMLNSFSAASKRSLNLAAGIRVFNKMGHVPATFHDVLRYMLINGHTDIEKIFTEDSYDSRETEHYVTTWSSLKLLDRTILIVIAREGGSLFSEEQRSKIATALGIDSLSKSLMQKAISRLKDATVIESYNRGQYEFNEIAFKNFVLNHCITGIEL